MADEMKELSMNDISRLAGVSVATVSRVINQKGRYSRETEKRVQEIVEKYHYTPNMTAKRLRTREQNFIGVIVPDVTNEFFARIAQIIQDGLRQHGYLALICNTGEDMDAQREYLDMLGIVNLAGMIFVSGSGEGEETRLRQFPTIYIDRTPESTQDGRTLVIESDNYGGACMAVRELYHKGCRRIAFMHSARLISTHSFRQNGYHDQMIRLGLEPDERLNLKVDEVTMEAAKASIGKLLDSGVPFDAVFCATDWLAAGTVAALEERGVAVPGQVKVIGFDDISIAGLMAKPLTTIHQQIDVLGQVAVREILRLIHGEQPEAQRMQIGVSLVKRETT